MLYQYRIIGYKYSLYFDIVSWSCVFKPLNNPVSLPPVGQGDLRFLHRELHPVSHKWYSLGVQLQISNGTLKRIELENRQMSNCLLEMLTVWLQCTNPTPTWDILTEALESPPVGERLLAQQLSDKYCPRSEGWVAPSYPIQGPSPSTAPSSPQGS